MEGWLGAWLVGLFAAVASGPDAAQTRFLAVDPGAMVIVKRSSGPVNYYSVVHEPGGQSYVHSAFRPSYKTAVLGYAVPDDLRGLVKKVRWRWRARVLPVGGNECAEGARDSAAVVYLTWKRGLRWYTLKYVWSAVGPKGAACDRKRNLFVAQDTVILESGGPLNVWKTVELDPDQAFREHFSPGDPDASVPELLGVGFMSDGDDTRSWSEADFGGLTLLLRDPPP